MNNKRKSEIALAAFKIQIRQEFDFDEDEFVNKLIEEPEMKNIEASPKEVREIYEDVMEDILWKVKQVLDDNF